MLTIAIAVFAAIVYGGTLLSSIVPWRRGTSWDGHLCGFIAGAGVAYWHANAGNEGMLSVFGTAL